MEKEGLSRSVQYIHNQNLTISTLITDCHASIEKWVRETLPGTTPMYYVWHVAKGICQQIVKCVILISASIKCISPQLHTGLKKN